jgi:hypothetical protein
VLFREKPVPTFSQRALLTGSEDFWFMLNARHGAFIFIGAGANPDGSLREVHTAALRLQ